MLRLIGLVLIGCFFVLSSCSGKNKQSNDDLLLQNVKAYFFLADSILVDVAVIDTIDSDEVEDMLAAIEKNLNLIDQDLDTLSLMIDDKAYTKMDYEKAIEKSILMVENKYKDSLNWAEKALLELQLKQAKLAMKKESFRQTNRFLLHFKRSIWANVAGYNITADYMVGEDSMHFELVTDANYKIVD